MAIKSKSKNKKQKETQHQQLCIYLALRSSFAVLPDIFKNKHKKQMKKQNENAIVKIYYC